jgi:hypothetical protein
MGKVVLLVLAVTLATACDDSDDGPRCADDASKVSVGEPLEALDGETAEARFDRITQKPWDCTVTWLELPESVGTNEPAAGSSPLELALERTSDTARYQKYSLTSQEKWETSDCHEDAVFVPSSLGLVSEDGALDETIACELRLQGGNTLLNLVLPTYDFAGTHRVTFADDIEKGPLELNLVYTPGADPTRITGSIVESGVRTGSGADPYLTAAAIVCTL